MEVLFYVMKKVDKLHDLLVKFHDHKVSNATIIDSDGMTHEISDNHDGYKLFSLHHLMNPKRKESKTIMIAIDESQREEVIAIIEEVVGDLEGDDTGAVFTMPINFVKGISKWK